MKAEETTCSNMQKALLAMMKASGNYALTARGAQVFLIVAAKEGQNQTAIGKQMSTQETVVTEKKVGEYLKDDWVAHINRQQVGNEKLNYLTPRGFELRRIITETLNL